MLIRRIGFIAVSRIMGLVSEFRVGCTALFSVYQFILVTVTFHCAVIIQLSEKHMLKFKKFPSCILVKFGTDGLPLIIIN